MSNGRERTLRESFGAARLQLEIRTQDSERRAPAQLADWQLPTASEEIDHVETG